MTFTGDELILIMISLVRATRPKMLRQEADGFSFDFEVITKSGTLDDDDRLLLKMRGMLEPPPPEGQPVTLDLTATEAQRLAGTLVRLEKLQAWPPDVLEMSRALRARLLPAS